MAKLCDECLELKDEEGHCACKRVKKSVREEVEEHLSTLSPDGKARFLTMGDFPPEGSAAARAEEAMATLNDQLSGAPIADPVPAGRDYVVGLEDMKLSITGRWDEHANKLLKGVGGVIHVEGDQVIEMPLRFAIDGDKAHTLDEAVGVLEAAQPETRRQVMQAVEQYVTENPTGENTPFLNALLAKAQESDERHAQSLAAIEAYTNEPSRAFEQFFVDETTDIDEGIKLCEKELSSGVFYGCVFGMTIKVDGPFVLNLEPSPAEILDGDILSLVREVLVMPTWIGETHERDFRRQLRATVKLTLRHLTPEDQKNVRLLHDRMPVAYGRMLARLDEAMSPIWANDIRTDPANQRLEDELVDTTEFSDTRHKFTVGQMRSVPVDSSKLALLVLEPAETYVCYGGRRKSVEAYQQAVIHALATPGSQIAVVAPPGSSIPIDYLHSMLPDGTGKKLDGDRCVALLFPNGSSIDLAQQRLKSNLTFASVPDVIDAPPISSIHVSSEECELSGWDPGLRERHQLAASVEVVIETPFNDKGDMRCGCCRKVFGAKEHHLCSGLPGKTNLSINVKMPGMAAFRRAFKDAAQRVVERMMGELFTKAGVEELADDFSQLIALGYPKVLGRNDAKSIAITRENIAQELSIFLARRIDEQRKKAEDRSKASVERYLSSDAEKIETGALRPSIKSHHTREALRTLAPAQLAECRFENLEAHTDCKLEPRTVCARIELEEVVCYGSNRFEGLDSNGRLWSIVLRSDESILTFDHPYTNISDAGVTSHAVYDETKAPTRTMSAVVYAIPSAYAEKKVTEMAQEFLAFVTDEETAQRWRLNTDMCPLVQRDEASDTVTFDRGYLLRELTGYLQDKIAAASIPPGGLRVNISATPNKVAAIQQTMPPASVSQYASSRFSVNLAEAGLGCYCVELTDINAGRAWKHKVDTTDTVESQLRAAVLFAVDMEMKDSGQWGRFLYAVIDVLIPHTGLGVQERAERLCNLIRNAEGTTWEAIDRIIQNEVRHIQTSASPYDEQAMIDLGVACADEVALLINEFWSTGRMKTHENNLIEKKMREAKARILAIRPERFARKESEA